MCTDLIKGCLNAEDQSWKSLPVKCLSLSNVNLAVDCSVERSKHLSFMAGLCRKNM